MTNTMIRKCAGGAFIAAPLLLAGGMLTSPPQAGDAPADYVKSLGDDFGLTVLSANLFHYGWVLLALALPAVLTLPRGRQGRRFTAVAVVLAMFGTIQMSGMLLSDWFNGAAATTVPLPQASRIFEIVSGEPSMAIWRLTAIGLSLAGLPLVMAGLARAGVLGWWAAPVVALPVVAAPIVGGALGSLVGLVCFAPLILVGLRLIQRSTPAVAAAEQEAVAAPA
ncbi:hypothetical protein Aab01nite_80900 [Paractinoplanes abujensis]|uniref:DUF4386 family protein n=1 Tax=Paractinoplanes abujensis TaxID=882441 RepID=A0A7W7CRC4_9ACTN|nr:hypothetical protein [Actinoplanes abujensis]MBB4693300.1 hypothetical protein [Actinoplanes abujensis]GID24500.1 hypothetical protein Aab01nite_80900 [Actinoplanes abujensis]